MSPSSKSTTKRTRTLPVAVVASEPPLATLSVRLSLRRTYVLELDRPTDRRMDDWRALALSPDSGGRLLATHLPFRRDLGPHLRLARPEINVCTRSTFRKLLTAKLKIVQLNCPRRRFIHCVRSSFFCQLATELAVDNFLVLATGGRYDRVHLSDRPSLWLSARAPSSDEAPFFLLLLLPPALNGTVSPSNRQSKNWWQERASRSLVLLSRPALSEPKQPMCER